VSAGTGGVYAIDVDPEALEVAANRWDLVADVVERAAQEYSRDASAIAPGEWSGFTRDAACAEMAGLGAELARFAPVLRRAPQALRRAADRARHAVEVDVPALRRQRQDALTDYAVRVRSARARADREGTDGAGGVPGGRVVDSIAGAGRPGAAAALDRAVGGAAEDRDEALRALDRRFADLVEDLREEFRVAARAIAQATVVPAAQEARAAYAAGGLDALDGTVLDPAAVTGALRESLPWTWATLDAARAAGLARELVDSPDRLTAQDLAELRTVLDAHHDDRVFAALFLQDLGARGLIDLDARMVLSIPRATVPGQEHAGLVAGTGDVQTALGTLLALATAAPGRPDQVTGEWVADLTRAGRERLGDLPPRSNLRGYHLLGTLLGHGTFSAQFLDTVGTDLLAFERAHAHPPGSAFWTDAAAGPLAPPRLDRSGPVRSPDHDPVAALLAAAARDPATARAFLTADTGEYSEQDMDIIGLLPNQLSPRLNRVDYLLTDRAWAPYPGRTGTSGPDALGHLLAVATTADPEDPGSHHIVESIAHEIVIDDRATGHPFATTDLVPPALRPHLATVLAAHIESLFDDHPLEAGTDMPSVGPSESTLLMAELGKDPDAYATLHRTVAAHTALLYDHDLHHPMTPDRVAGAMESVSRSAGDLLGALDHGAALTDIDRVTTGSENDPRATAAAFDLATALLDRTVPDAGTAAGAVAAGPAGAAAAATAAEAIRTGAHALLGDLEKHLTTTRDATGTLDRIARTRFTNGADTLHGTLEAAIVRTLPHDVLEEAHILDRDGNLLPQERWERPDEVMEKIKNYLEYEDPRVGLKAVLDGSRNLYGQGRDNAEHLESRR